MASITNTLISPGINVSEIDLTAIVPRLGTTVGAIAGIFNWGPVGERMLISSEANLLNTFGKPNSNNAETWFTAANFLTYGNTLWVVRAANTTSGDANAALSAIGNSAAVANIAAATVLNEIDFANKKANSYSYDANAMFVAKFPGALGNSIKVSVCDSVNSFSSNVNVTNSTPANVVAYPSYSNTFLANSTGFANGSVAGSGNSAFFITSANTYYPANTRVYYAVSSANTPVAPLTGNTYYYVSFSNSSVLKLSSTLGGANINITDTRVTGAGESHTFTSDAATGTPNTVTGSFYIGFGNTSANLFVTITNSAMLANASYSANVIAATNVWATSISGSFAVGDIVVMGNSAIGYQYNKIKAIGPISANSTGTILPFVFADNYKNATDYQVTPGINANGTVGYLQRYWEFQNVISTPPQTSQYVFLNGNTQNWASNTANTPVDGMHVVITDNLGSFTGTPGAVLEVYPNVSRANDAIGQSGSSIFWQNVLNAQSNYVWALNQRPDKTANTGNSATILSGSNNAPLPLVFNGGQDGINEANISLATIASAYNLFQNPTDVQINLLMQGKPIGGTYTSGTPGSITANNFNLANYLIDNIATTRKDCVVFITPDDAIVYNNKGAEAAALVTWRNVLHSTSYAVMDSGYKYMYDRYNDVYRYVPTNGDIAGLCVATDLSNEPWYSPAGFNRGQIKNLIRMRYNPGPSDRDLLFSNGINPVVTFQGQGTILFGDKTLSSKASAFDHINVRRLFITIEQAIRTASDGVLFEFNDAFTRANFVNLITPYLKNIKSLRGVTDFYIVCDESNNTPQRVDSNQFWCDIYIKPARSINFIQLNFVAVASGVQFTEVLGQY
jgi:hypothetical protein